MLRAALLALKESALRANPEEFTARRIRQGLPDGWDRPRVPRIRTVKGEPTCIGLWQERKSLRGERSDLKSPEVVQRAVGSPSREAHAEWVSLANGRAQ